MFGILLTDLSQAFDCFSNELFVAKLNTYGLEASAVCLTFDYHERNYFRSSARISFGTPVV